MDFLEFIGYIRQFNADTAILGAAVWILVFLLRKTLLKRVRSKLLPLLPFAAGILVYAAYCAAIHGFSGTDWNTALNGGITCGSIATVAEVVYGQFSKDGNPDIHTDCVKTLLAGYGRISDAVAADIAAAVQADDEQTALALLGEITGEGMASTLYCLIRNTLQELNG